MEPFSLNRKTPGLAARIASAPPAVLALILALSCAAEDRCDKAAPRTRARPTAVAFSSDGTELFVLNANGDRRYCQAFVSRYELPAEITEPARWAAQVPVPGVPGTLARVEDPAGARLLVTLVDPDQESNLGRLLVLGPDLEQKSLLPLAVLPHWQAVGPDGAPQWAALSSRLQPRLQLIDLGPPEQAADSLNLVELGVPPGRANAAGNATPVILPEETALVALPEGERLLVVDSALYELDLPDGKVTRRSLLWSIDPGARAVAASAHVGIQPRSVAVDSLHRVAFVSSVGGLGVPGEVVLVDLAPGDPPELLTTLDFDPSSSTPQGLLPDLGAEPFDLLLTPDRRTLFVSDADAPRVYEIDLGGFVGDMEQTGSPSLKAWFEAVRDRSEDPRMYFPTRRVIEFKGKASLGLAYDTARARLAVADAQGNDVYLYDLERSAGRLLGD